MAISDGNLTLEAKQNSVQSRRWRTRLQVTVRGQPNTRSRLPRVQLLVLPHVSPHPKFPRTLHAITKDLRCACHERAERRYLGVRKVLLSLES
eukprot:4761168-Amphidinium_carterae.1